MASLRQRESNTREIERVLDIAFRDWQTVRGIADAESGEWDDFSRLSWAVEWPLAESRLPRLTPWASRGLLTSDHAHRYDELLCLVAELRPTLDRLLSEN